MQATEDLKPTINNALSTSLGNLDLACRQVGLIFRGDAFPVVDYGYNYRAPILTLRLRPGEWQRPQQVGRQQQQGSRAASPSPCRPTTTRGCAS